MTLGFVMLCTHRAGPRGANRALLGHARLPGGHPRRQAHPRRQGRTPARRPGRPAEHPLLNPPRLRMGHLGHRGRHPGRRQPDAGRVSGRAPCLPGLGSCLPLRPVDELRAYLDERPRTDFIESVTTADVGWTVGGLNYERFTLRFPFSWRKHRWLFDTYVELQRFLRVRRKMPAGIVPHLGSQWWCLTRQTLSAILEGPDREEYDRYFRKVWIPDESYFQTLVRQVSSNVESRSLTLSKFDFQGKPHIFYDDHLQLLKRSDCFVARKIWPQANRLYDTFPVAHRRRRTAGRTEPRQDRPAVRQGRGTPHHGRAGLYMQSRFSQQGMGTGPHRRALFHLRGLCRGVREFRHLAFQGLGHPRAWPHLRARPGRIRRRRHHLQRLPVRQRDPARLQPPQLPDQPDLEHPRANGSASSSAPRTTRRSPNSSPPIRTRRSA